MKFNEAAEIALDPSVGGSKSKGVVKGKKNHKDEFIKVGKKAKGQGKK